MSKLSEQRKKEIEEDKAHCKQLLKNEAEFNKVFEETFNHYDKNKDGIIDFVEYNEFLQNFLQRMGRKCYNIANTTKQWERVDKDKNGEITKDEFKREFIYRMIKFANS